MFVFSRCVAFRCGFVGRVLKLFLQSAFSQIDFGTRDVDKHPR